MDNRSLLRMMLGLSLLLPLAGCSGDAKTDSSGTAAAERQLERDKADEPVSESVLAANAEPAAIENEFMKEAREALAGFGLSQQLQDSEAWQKSEATLNRLGKEALPALVEGLKHEDAVVREQASARIAQLIEHVPDREQLAEGLEDSSVWVRVNVASALSFGGDQADRAIPALRGLCQVDDTNLRVQAAVALGNYAAKAKAAVPELIELLASEEPRIRSAAATALGKIGAAAEAALEPLRERLQDSMEEVRTAAAIAIEQITTQP